ncbi:predicted protein [Postia placenta Mad-698-R]|nr:predicted protein [Postia placenta Mad-698-R]
MSARSSILLIKDMFLPPRLPCPAGRRRIIMRAPQARLDVRECRLPPAFLPRSPCALVHHPQPASDLIPTTPTNIPHTAPQVVRRLSGGRPISGQVDTKTGGEAGMAGVGRRGFAAAAHAALFLAHFEPRNGPVEHELPPSMVPGQGMDGRRANAPKFLDIASATTYGTSTLSPRSPFSQKSPVSAGVPSPLSRTHPAALTSPSAPIVASSPTSPVGSALRHDRVVSPGMEPPKTPLSATPTTPSAASIRLPFFEKFKDSKLRSELQPEDNLDTTAPDSDAESDYGGLAYARSSADEDEDEDKPLKTKLPPISTSVTPASDSDHKDKVRFPSIAGSESHYSESPVSPRLPQRSLSASTGTSTYSARTIAKSTGALDRVMETLLEDVVSPSTSAAASPAPLTAPLLPENQRDSRPPKLPTRSHTSPTLGTGRVEQARGKKRVKERVCAKCTKIIDDGRWIQMEGGSVLCDKCWKSMYLPKVRAAVCLVPGCETDDVVVGDSAGDAA